MVCACRCFCGVRRTPARQWSTSALPACHKVTRSRTSDRRDGNLRKLVVVVIAEDSRSRLVLPCAEPEDYFREERMGRMRFLAGTWIVLWSCRGRWGAWCAVGVALSLVMDTDSVNAEVWHGKQRRKFLRIVWLWLGEGRQSQAYTNARVGVFWETFGLLSGVISFWMKYRVLRIAWTVP